MIEQIGQLIITGFEGREPSGEFLDFFREENLGGVILFEDNCTPHSLAEDTLRQVQSLARGTAFAAVDQEGGRVCRFRGVPVEYGAASDYGRANNISLYEEQFTRAAYYLSALGINLLLGPVADLDLKEDNTCLQGRTFGKSAAQVIPFIEKSIAVCKKSGLLSCLKHFPGLGDAHNDPHQKLATADYDFQTFINREGLAFLSGMESGADMVMTTHLLLPRIDSLPATQSEVIVRQILRGKLGFDGVVITDDILMLGAGDPKDAGDTALKAINSGHDIVLVGRNFAATRQIVSHLKEAYRTGKLGESKLRRSLNRISGVKSKIAQTVT